MSDGSVTLEILDGVALVTLRRPARLNALAGDMREQLLARMQEAAEAPDLRAMVVTGEGRAFCAGGDVATMADLRRENDLDGFRSILRAGADCALALASFPGLTVAAVNGVAAGAGLSMALLCDLRVAVPDARLVASWGGIGLAPDWGATYLLPRILGPARALRCVLECEAIDAAKSVDLGLLHEVVAPDHLSARARELALRLGEPKETVLAAKRLLSRGHAAALAAALAAETEEQMALFSSPAVAAGLADFEARRRSRRDSRNES